MEGEGPSAGVPKKIGLILGSTDAVATRIVGYEPGRIFTTYYAQVVDRIFIWKDNLFLLDRDRGARFYQHKIIEKYPGL
jgi:hypothetical protein